jgi:hypothetical protein
VLSDGLAASFGVLRRNGLGLTAVSIAVFVPVDLAAALVDRTLGWGDSSAVQLLAVALIVTIGATLAYGAAISLAHAGSRSTPSLAQALLHALRRLPTLLLLTLLSCLGIVLGLLLLVIPGLVLATWWFLSYPAVMIENDSALESLERSRALIRGAFWPTFIVVVPLLGVSLAVAYGAWRAGFTISASTVGAGLGSAVGDAIGAVLWAAFAMGWFETLRARSAPASSTP